MAHCPRLICPSAALAERGKGERFSISERAADDKAFAVRFRGVVRAYVNRCPHMGTELDWQPGEFFEESGLYLICSTHGALFEPETGYCVAGPCRGASLEPLCMHERDGQVHFLTDAPAPRAAGPTHKT